MDMHIFALMHLTCKQASAAAVAAIADTTRSSLVSGYNLCVYAGCNMREVLFGCRSYVVAWKSTAKTITPRLPDIHHASFTRNIFREKKII